ncbi:hypothetical protein BDZ94DRAFT_1266552 [Collybia nuda]|uniref:Uncharacterized protein n=1 Tax=Collybia nuda TaxID=64659 RepID=A0A9P5Y0U7_9AGAR|nr:hypothetical protein BDZ94DRAFT_1266552 [Collybia nuda]
MPRYISSTPRLTNEITLSPTHPSGNVIIVLQCPPPDPSAFPGPHIHHTLHRSGRNKSEPSS